MASASRPKKTALIVAQRIVEDINERGNRVGDRLPPERVMLEDYNVGRSTLRESLRFLELQGVISLRPGPNGGPMVQQPDASALATSLSLLLQFAKAPFMTVVETRVALEPPMARLAAERRTDAHLTELRDAVAAEHAALSDQASFLRATRRFHTAVATASGNDIFSGLFSALVEILDGGAMGIVYPERERQLTNELHTRIVDAIETRDADLAAKLMRAQMEALQEYMQQQFSEQLAAPIVWNAD